MTLLAQVGYGRSDKIQTGIQAGSISGAILSPRDEDPAKLASFVQTLRNTNPASTILFDPQFYAATIVSPRDQYLSKYPYYSQASGLNRTQFKPKEVNKYVSDCLDYQTNSLPDLTYQISPSVLFEDFRDSWSQIALSMAESAIDKASYPHKLLISLIISEQAFKSSDALDEFLDALSSLEVGGFYILICRNVNGHPCNFDSSILHNIMYLTYVLGAINDYKVFFGYTDWYGALLMAAGAHSVATGWWQNLRNFSLTRFLPTSGFARRPKKRYPSTPLLSSTLFIPELEGINSLGWLSQVLSGITQDHVFNGVTPVEAEQNWSDETYCLAQWEAMSNLLASIASQTQNNRLTHLLALINKSKNLYDLLMARGIIFDANTGPRHLESWCDSIQAFNAKISSAKP